MKATITLSSCLDSQVVEALAAALSEKRGYSLTLDCRHVDFVGALAAQLLVAAFRQWREDGKSFEFEFASDNFVNGLALLGIPPSTLGLTGNCEVMQ